ncbi:MAG: CRISPR-associated protein Cas4 [Thermodesulfobacteriota bacterium]|nr:CRISPR-associated protein Cas4 [Thermodesulfobacteriota bacterium]
MDDFAIETSAEREPVHVSALNQYIYCPRRCALIYVEQTWDENIYTMRGRNLHENVDIDSSHIIAGIRYETALPIWSNRLNLVGKADLVEFHGDIPYPVEYKVGRRKSFENDALQLCAQAVCLEEMLGVPVPKGALYWHGSRKRKEITFTPAMRVRLEEVVSAVHKMIAERYVPPPVNDKRCKDCSLKESCLPHVVGNQALSRKAERELFVISVMKEG